MNEGPELLRDILGRLFTAKGWGRQQGNMHLAQVWADCAGPDFARYTRLAGLRRGVLEVEVANSILLQELAQFHKRKLLDKLRRALPTTKLADLRFRAGSWKTDS